MKIALTEEQVTKILVEYFDRNTTSGSRPQRSQDHTLTARTSARLSPKARRKKMSNYDWWLDRQLYLHDLEEERNERMQEELEQQEYESEHENGEA